VVSQITDAEYSALAELRFRIRMFLREGDLAARQAGLEPQQYLMLLAIRGIPRGTEPTIRVLADRLALKHHSAVELIDRLEVQGLARRSRSRGEKLLEDVAVQRLSELRSSGESLVKTIASLLEHQPKKKTKDPTRPLRKKGK
jgi:DNA-binding MarR family transcriptional regulator